MLVQKKIDKYLLLGSERLGKGSFAEVFKGRLVEGPGEFAIKVIDKKQLTKDEYLRSALFNEISIMKKVKSENVVRLEEVLETSHNYYIIQEYCNGGTLREHLRASGRVEEESAAKMLRHILAGFLPLLKFGIIHRDLKPENILLHNLTLKIADFGFAKSLYNFERQMMESTVGTPLYMSPQILKEERYSSKSDVWSIGLIYYEILHGEHPYAARSEKELLKKIETKKLEYSPLLSPAGKDFIARCLGVTEESRLSWEEVYRHPYVAEYFKAYIEEENKLEDRALFVINQLRAKVLQNNLDLEGLFKSVDTSKDGSLSKKELYRLLLSIDRGISKEEVIYIFNKFDKDGSNSIEFVEFRDWLEQSGLKFKHEALPAGLGEQGEAEAHALKALQLIKESVQMLDMDLHEFFSKFGKKDKDELDFSDFESMVLRINKELKPAQVELVFAKFDANGDRRVTFDEFKSLLYKISGRPVLDESFKRDLEEALKHL